MDRGDYAKAKALAEQALEAAPMNARALRILGSVASDAGDGPRAAALMTTAERMSRRDLRSQLWLLDWRTRQGQYQAAVKNADALLRNEGKLGVGIYPLLNRIAEAPEGRKALLQALVRQPSWRPAFLDALAANGEITAAQTIFSRLAQTTDGVTTAEISVLVRRLFAMQRYDEAAAVWRRLSPPAVVKSGVGLVNGGFEDLESAVPFTWEEASSETTLVEFTAPPDRAGNPALHILHDGFDGGTLLLQTTVLPPGAYVFTGVMMSDSPLAKDYIQWRISCAEGGVVLATGGFAYDRRWTKFELPFESPPGCGAQRIQLLALPEERRIRVEAWYDDVSIQPARRATTEGRK